MTAMTEQQMALCRTFSKEQTIKAVKVASIQDLTLDQWLKEIDRIVGDYLTLKEELSLTRA